METNKFHCWVQEYGLSACERAVEIFDEAFHFFFHVGYVSFD
jgi:hypothetical protein